MKSIVLALRALVASALLSMGSAVVSGQGSIVINAGYVNLGPNRTTQQLNEISYAMMNNLTSYGSWSAITSNQTLDITSVFGYNNNGKGLGFAVGISSLTPIPFSSISYNLNSAYDTASNTFGNQGYTLNALGATARSWGPDNIKGTADDVIYTSGSPASINEFYGLAKVFSVDIGFYGGTIQQATAAGIAAWTPLTPFRINMTYGAANTFATTSFGLDVPEPSVFALITIGSIGFLVRKRS